MSNERIQAALDKTHDWNKLNLPQSAFNLLRNSYLAERQLREALEQWADTVLGPEENGGSKERWADDGGGNLSDHP